MQNPNLADALADANAKASEEQAAKDSAPSDELSDDDLNLISGGLLSSSDCPHMSCETFN